LCGVFSYRNNDFQEMKDIMVTETAILSLRKYSYNNGDAMDIMLRIPRRQFARSDIYAKDVAREKAFSAILGELTCKQNRRCDVTITETRYRDSGLRMLLYIDQEDDRVIDEEFVLYRGEHEIQSFCGDYFVVAYPAIAERLRQHRNHRIGVKIDIQRHHNAK
jgi:hypothetical protein